MSREAFDVREPYTGTGLVDTYTFDFKIESADQLLIKEYDENGVETQSLRGDDIGAYLQSITFDEIEGGGSIVLVDPLTEDYTLVLLLANDEPLQEYTFKNKSDFTLDRIEAALDYIVGALQRAAYLVERSVTLPDLLTTASFDPTLPTDIVSGEAGRILAVNDAKTGWEFGPTTDSIFAAETAAGLSADEAAASAAAALASATAADVSEASALVAETNAELAQAGAETAETNAAASAAAAAISAANPADDSVTNAKLANMATQTIKGRTTAGTGDPEDLTATQATAILNSMVGDSGSGGTKGLVPAPAAGDAAAVKFLKADGTWEVPAGAGTVTSVDMTVPPLFSVSGNPITGAGTLALTGGPDSSKELTNLTIVATVGSSALTVNFKTKAGADPSATSPIQIGYRNATVATGTYSQVSTTSALTALVVSSGSTLGHTSGVPRYIYVYSINNAGATEVAVSSYLYDEGSVVSTTAEGGAGAADSGTAIYSTTARTGVPVRLVGRLLSNQATAGTWNSSITEISLPPFQAEPNYVESVAADNNPPGAAGAYGDAASISLTPGLWSITAHGYFRNGGATTTTGGLIGISTTSGNSGSGLDDTTNQAQAAPMKSQASGAIEFLSVANYVVRVTATTTHYLKVLANGSVTNLAFGGRITAVRLNR